MEAYRTEEEQIEAIKKWWVDNGRSTMIAIVVACAGYFGFHGWQTHTQNEIASASQQYQLLLEAVPEAGAPVDEAKKATLGHLAEVLKTEHKGSVYAHYAALLLAKQAVEANDLDKAVAELSWVLEQKPASEVSELASLRLARVTFAQGKDDEALALIEKTQAVIFGAGFEELRGDIALAKGDRAQAGLHYRKGVELQKQANQPVGRVLEMKAKGLAEADASVVVKAASDAAASK